MIECSLRPMGEYGSALPGYSNKKRQGKYHGSEFHFEGYGIKKWVVGVYIEYDDQLNTEMSHDDIVRGCIEYLNQPPPRKKYQKKKPKPQFGNIDKTPYSFRFNQDENGSYIEALLITDQRKNKKFWGAGGEGRVKRKRGRPRKDEQ